MSDLDHLRELTTQFRPPPFDDLVSVSGTRRRRSAVGAGVAFAAVVIIATAVAGGVTDRSGADRDPVGPATNTTHSPTDAASGSTGWEPPEPLRPAASGLVQVDHDEFGNPTPWDDGRDAPFPVIDIVSIGQGHQYRGGSSFGFLLASRAPLDPADRVIAYGVAVDGDGDQIADCQIGVNNNAPVSGHFHVWVTNLDTRQTTVQDGPPYGAPVEFAHPAEEGMAEFPPLMQFGFLRGLRHPDPCEPFGDASAFYAWASLTEGGQVVARDYAPEDAWMPIVWGPQEQR